MYLLFFLSIGAARCRALFLPSALATRHTSHIIHPYPLSPLSLVLACINFLLNAHNTHRIFYTSLGTGLYKFCLTIYTRLVHFLYKPVPFLPAWHNPPPRPRNVLPTDWEEWPPPRRATIHHTPYTIHHTPYTLFAPLPHTTHPTHDYIISPGSLFNKVYFVRLFVIVSLKKSLSHFFEPCERYYKAPQSCEASSCIALDCLR